MYNISLNYNFILFLPYKKKNRDGDFSGRVWLWWLVIIINGATSTGNLQICSCRTRGSCIRMGYTRVWQPGKRYIVRQRNRCKPERRLPRKRSAKSNVQIL